MESTWLIIGLVNGAWIGFLFAGHYFVRIINKLRKENVDLKIELKAR